MTLTDLDWTVMTVAATIATAIATSASVSLSMLWRLADRERAEWVTFDGRSWWRDIDRAVGEPGPAATAKIANIGRGPALAVRATGFGCHAALRNPVNDRPGAMPSELIPALVTGESAGITVWCDPEDWEHARVAITWTASPRVLRTKRLHWIALSRIAGAPNFERRRREGETPQREEPPSADLSWFPPDHPLPPQRTDLLGWLRLRRALLRG